MSEKRKPYKFTPEARAAALRAMAKTGNRWRAAEAAGVSLSTIERYISEDPSFKEDLVSAKAAFVETLEAEAYRRAVDGWLEPKNMGPLAGVMDVRKFDSTLLLHLLKKNDPDKHGDKVKIDQTTVQVTTDLALDQLSEESRAQLEEILLREAGADGEG